MTNPAPSPARIAYLGPPGTHSHAAALGLFGHGAALHPVAALPDLVASLGSSADYAVVPFANGKSGIVGLANDAIIARPGLKCWADRDHKVSHCLLARLDVAKPFEASERTEKESEIKELLNNVSVVYSHNEAIGQCSAFLSTFLPHARLERVQSTARAAELASQEPNSAALASEVCSEIYGIPCVARDAQDADGLFLAALPFQLKLTVHFKQTTQPASSSSRFPIPPRRRSPNRRPRPRDQCSISSHAHQPNAQKAAHPK